MYGKGLRTLSVATLLILGAPSRWSSSTRPNDADQGFVQKIFYIHVPMAIVSLCGFVPGGIFAIGHLRTRDAR